MREREREKERERERERVRERGGWEIEEDKREKPDESNR